MLNKKAKFKQELSRKVIHLSSLWIPVLYYISNFAVMLLVFSIITPIFVACDILRHRKTRLGKKVRLFCTALKLDNIFRLHEKRGGISGASYMLISALICLIVFPKPIFIIAFVVLMIADSAAALIGMRFGISKVVGSKTFLGTMAFFGVSGVIATVLSYNFGLDMRHAVFAAGITTLAEMLSEKLKVDDNLLIPLVFGFWYMLIRVII